MQVLQSRSYVVNRQQDRDCGLHCNSKQWHEDREDRESIAGGIECGISDRRPPSKAA